MSSDAPAPTSAARPIGPELRLVDRRAFVGFPALDVARGLRITDFALLIPDVTFPFNVTGGATRYQKKKLDFGYLELTLDADVVAQKLAGVAGRVAELDDLKLSFRAGFIEGQARLRTPERAPLTFKMAFDGDGEALAVYLYDVRFYAFSTTPAVRIPAMLAEGLKESGLLPAVERRGANGFSTRVLAPLVELSAVSRGFKMPSLDQARLSEAVVSSQGLRLRFTSGGLPPTAPPDEELLLTLEGARAFAEAEEWVALGKLDHARDAYLKLGDANEAHPFAAERLLSLLVADPQAHDMALDVAASLSRRRPKSAAAMWGEAVARERRGEPARAAERYLALCQVSRAQNEETAAFFAAEAAARSAREEAPQVAVRALHEVLGLRPDHLPSLKALARASDLAQDRAGAMRAYRRLAALARDAVDAADAHVHLARLSAQTEDDIAGARLHCEAALRLSPDNPDALYLLGELCFKSGEHLRAVRALDRLREVGLGRHEVDRVGRANMLAGRVWEEGLKQPENALLRFRAAASMLPGDPLPLYHCAHAAEGLGRLSEAVAGYQQAIELAGPTPRTDDARRAAHQSHHALARLFRTQLGEPARSRDHLELAWQLEPNDVAALDELLPYFRATGRAVELADACERAAQVTEDAGRRAALWAEAGELYRGRLSQADKADRLLSLALEADPKNVKALEGMLALAESKRDGGALCRCLKALSELTDDAKDRVRYLRRLAVAARDLAFDLELSVFAFKEVLKFEGDDLPSLGELCALERRRADMPGLAWALERRAQAGEGHGDKRLAAAALRELAQVLEVRLGRPGEALAALEKSARLFPDVNALLDLSALAMRCERPLNSRQALEDVLTLLPKHAAPDRLAEVRARLGQACEALGDRDGARENFALAYPVRRLDDALFSRLEVLYEESGHSRELFELWASRAQALVQAGRPAEAAPLFFKSAQSLIGAGDKPAALLRLREALEASPTGERAAEIVAAMAELELDRGERLEAAKLWARRSGFEKEGRPAARFLLKAAQLTEGTPREEAYLDQAVELDATFAPARVRRADVLLKTDPRAALTDMEAALAADVRDPDTLAANIDRVELARKAAFAALKVDHTDTARRHLAWYASHRPEDLEAQLELVHLHRKAGASEALVDLLGQLWPRLEGASQAAARHEYAEGALKLGRTEAAAAALRSILSEDPRDVWATERLFELLPDDAAAGAERLDLLTRLITLTQGEARALRLSQRALVQRNRGRFVEAFDDFKEAASLSSHPEHHHRSMTEVARAAQDDAREFEAWTCVLKSAADASVQETAASRLSAIASSRFSAGDVALAQKAWEAVVALPVAPQVESEAHFELARCALALGEKREAEAQFELASKAGPPARRIEALQQRMELLEARGAHVEVARAAEAALVLSPAHEPSLAALKRALKATQNYAGLADVLASEVLRTPKVSAAPLFAELAALYLDKLDEPGPGEVALRRWAALENRGTAPRERLFTLAMKRADVAEAAHWAHELSQIAPASESGPRLFAVGRLAAKTDDKALALKLLREAHALAPAQGADVGLLGELLFTEGALREALPLLRAYADTVRFDDEPENSEAAHLRLADAAEQVGDVALAEATLRKLLGARPLLHVAVERLASLVAQRSPRESLFVLAEHDLGLLPSPRAVEHLAHLAQRALKELSDVDLASHWLERAIAAAEDKRHLREARAAVLRSASRHGALIEELKELGALCLRASDREAALNTFEELARLAEEHARIDEALLAISSMADVCEDDGEPTRAAAYLRRKAELLRDAKLDLERASETLEQAWTLSASPLTADMGLTLARRRGDRDAEIDWLERVLSGLGGAPEKAAAFVALARLHLGLPADGEGVTQAAWSAPDQAEASLRKALDLVPGHASAELHLQALLSHEERPADWAGYLEEAAARARDSASKSRLLLEAARVYKDEAGRPHEAVAALFAARAANPDDQALVQRIADVLHDMQRGSDAADFDALLLDKDPHHAVFARHRRWLIQTKDFASLADLLTRRAALSTGDAAAALWLEAAEAFRSAGADERARLCETQAFDLAPTSEAAFLALRSRYQGEPRRIAELLRARADAVPTQAPPLLKERAQALDSVRDGMLAAAAWDDYLRLVPGDASAQWRRAELAAEAGGARSAQPFLRAWVSLPDTQADVDRSLRAWLQLGQAAAEANAWHDAADAFSKVLSFDSSPAREKEVLPLLVEAHRRRGDRRAQYDATVKLAKSVSGDEAQALYRSATELVDSPEQAAEAWAALFAKDPMDVSTYRAHLAALSKSDNVDAVIAAHRLHAASVGGAAASDALLEAARVAQGASRAQSATELRREAAQAAPHAEVALRALVDDAKARGDRVEWLSSLQRLVEGLAPSDAQDVARLEWATLAEAQGAHDDALRGFELLVDGGATRSGFAEAAEGLERLARAQSDRARLVKALSAKAELVTGAARAALCLEAAQTAMALEDFEVASRLARQSLGAHAQSAAYEVLGAVARAQGQWSAAALALTEAAALATAQLRPALLHQALALRESAGENDEAAELVERLLKEEREGLSPEEAADRLASLGKTGRALEVGAEPFLAKKAYEKVLFWADRSQDDALVQRILWAWAKDDPQGPAAARLEAALSNESDAQSFAEVSSLLREGGLSGRADALDVRSFERFGDEAAARRLAASGALEGAVTEWLASGKVEAYEKILPFDDALTPALRERLWAQLADAKENLRPQAYQKLAAAQRARADHAALVQTLAMLSNVERDAHARAALFIERGELLRNVLARPDEARASFERALADEGHALPAVRALVDLYQGHSTERFAAMCERLEALAGPEAGRPYQEALAEAYETLGRPNDAYRVLGSLAPSDSVRTKRVRLAEALGYVGDALRVKEELAQNDSERLDVLRGYVKADLVPFAARLATSLLEGGALAGADLRFVAERLSTTPQGSHVAIAAWGRLLNERWVDVDGWTLLSEALRHAGRHEASHLADAFGAALSGEGEKASVMPQLNVVALGSVSDAEPPPDALPVTESTMARLSSGLSELLLSLGLPKTSVLLDVQGGIEAFWAGDGVWVVGAGAVSTLQMPELAFLAALSRALGNDARALSGFAPVAGLADAAVRAFNAVPSPLAAAKLLCLVDDRVRGSDPALVHMAQVLPSSAAFEAVARHALRMLTAS